MSQYAKQAWLTAKKLQVDPSKLFACAGCWLERTAGNIVSNEFAGVTTNVTQKTPGTRTDR